MKVFLVQLDQVWELPEQNCQKIESMLMANPPEKGGLIVLPEMFSTGFSMTGGGHSGDFLFLSRLALQYQCYVMGGTVTVGENQERRNTCFTFSPEGSVLSTYHKQRLFRFSQEHEHYSPGMATEVFELGEFVVSPFVCYDLRFPELFRRSVAKGTHLFVVIASWPARRIQHWLTLLQARAIENQCYVVAVNRVGQDPNAHYSGRSVVVNPQGMIVADAGDREGILSAELHLNEVQEWRSVFPALLDLE